MNVMMVLVIRRAEREAIPLEARIITVADSFDAMVAERPYKKGFSLDQALEELRGKSGSQFDPMVAEFFCRYVENKMPLKEWLPEKLVE